MVITSRSNHHIKRARSLLTAKGRQQEGCWLLEGIRVIEEALRHKTLFDTLFYTKVALENQRTAKVFNKIRLDGINVFEVSGEVLKSISDTQTPSGLVALVKSPDILTCQTPLDENSWLLVLDNISDPGNLGSILRTALAVEIDKVVLLPGSVDPGNPKVIRSSAGAVLGLPLIRLNNEELLLWLKMSNIVLATLDINGSKELYQVDWRGSKALLVGNEAHGPSPELIKASSLKVRIPMSCQVESLNAAIATGVALYEAYRQRRQ